MAQHGQRRQQQVVVVTGRQRRHRPGDGDRLRRQGRRGGAARPRGGGSEGAAKEVEAAGGRALVVPVDVADADAVERAAATVEERLGPIDVWVNVAFTSVFAPFWEIGAEEFARVTEVSYLGYVYGTMAALSRMRARDRGTIVQVGSALAYRGIPLQTAYCGVQARDPGVPRGAALRAAARASSGVHVTMVQMPAVNTPQFSWVLSRLPRPGPAGAADLPAGGRRQGGRCTPPTTRGDASTGSVAARWARWSPTRSRRGCWTATWPGPASPPSRPTSPGPGPAGQPLGAGRPATEDFGAHGRFDDRSTTRSLQLWASQHHGLLGAAAGAAAAGTVVLARALRR